MKKELKRHKVGELRPSQVLTTYGVGSIVDLPHLSVMVMGLDDWPVKDSIEIGEPRLLASIRQVLGDQVQALRSAPISDDSGREPFDSSNFIGIPVSPFPQWMVCPICHRLAPLSSGIFRLETGYRPDQVRYIHANCNKANRPPTVVPARFIVACKNGHLADFPWREFVHRGGTSCKGGLKLVEFGASGEAADVQVECDSCPATRRMSDAFKIDQPYVIPCNGRRPHLRDQDEGVCKDTGGAVVMMKAMLQGASNAWFALSLSALALPKGQDDDLSQFVEESWNILSEAESRREIELLLKGNRDLRDLNDYPADEIWQVVQARKAEDKDAQPESSDLKLPEWSVFSNPSAVPKNKDFQLREIDAPPSYQEYFERVVLVEKLREVRALVGFTRIESPADYDTPAAFPAIQRASLSRGKPIWVPASEIRGEGIFIQFRERPIHEWLTNNAEREREFFAAHCQWRQSRGLMPAGDFWPGLRFLLLHSFAHALIRELGIECGYTTASLRERIYSTAPAERKPPMAGVLIYTAAPDSEGTLGGLVALGTPERLGRHIDQALDQLRFCASDPLCAEHHPGRDGISLHGASCHACLFTPETSCERSNRYLDRALLVETVDRSDLAFFSGV